jgi:hypothetical protein
MQVREEKKKFLLTARSKAGDGKMVDYLCAETGRSWCRGVLVQVLWNQLGYLGGNQLVLTQFVDFLSNEC